MASLGPLYFYVLHFLEQTCQSAQKELPHSLWDCIKSMKGELSSLQ